MKCIDIYIIFLPRKKTEKKNFHLWSYLNNFNFLFMCGFIVFFVIKEYDFHKI